MASLRETNNPLSYQAASYSGATGRGVPGVSPSEPYPTSGGGSNPYGTMWSLFNAANGANESSINSQILQQLQRAGLVNANQQTQTGYINQGAGFGRERLGLSGERLGIQQGALNRAAGMLPQSHEWNLADLALQQKQAEQGADISRRGLTSDATARGAMSATGTVQGFGDIANQLANSLEYIGRNRGRENMSYQENQASLEDQRKNLDIASRSLGIDGRELEANTQQALNNLGLQTALNTSDIFQAIAQLQAGRFNPIQQLLPMLYQVGGATY